MKKTLIKQKTTPKKIREKKTSVLPRSSKQDGQKKCIITGQFFPKEEMIRFVIDADGQLIPDIAGKLDGHGIWVYADKQALQRAIKAKRPFRKAVHKDMIFFESLAETVEIQMIKRCQNLLGLANKAGLVTAGYTKVEKVLSKTKNGVLLTAPDASFEQIKKLGLEDKAFNVTVLHELTAEDMGRALGLPDTVFVFVAAGDNTKKLFSELARLALYRRDTGENKEAAVVSEDAEDSKVKQEKGL